jgi:RHS repeat-associated protein
VPVPFAAGAISPPSVRPTTWTPNAQTQIDVLVAGYQTFLPPLSQYEYDTAGNRKAYRHGATTTTYVSNSRNEYSSVNSTTLTYTLAGRVLSDARFRYMYNFRGQLAQAQEILSGGIEVQVFHDALGRPIASIERGRTRVIVLDGMSPIEFYDNGVLSTVNASEGRDQLCFFAFGGRDEYVVRDVVESTCVTMDSKGVVTGFFGYDPFGALLAGTPATPIRFAGKYSYESVGWYEFLLRQYLPALGRFAQPDPTGFGDGANLFTFLGNNPLSGRDPNGTDRQKVDPEIEETRSTIESAVANAKAEGIDPYDLVAQLVEARRDAQQHPDQYSKGAANELYNAWISVYREQARKDAKFSTTMLAAIFAVATLPALAYAGAEVAGEAFGLALLRSPALFRAYGIAISVVAAISGVDFPQTGAGTNAVGNYERTGRIVGPLPALPGKLTSGRAFGETFQTLSKKSAIPPEYKELANSVLSRIFNRRGAMIGNWLDVETQVAARQRVLEEPNVTLYINNEKICSRCLANTADILLEGQVLTVVDLLGRAVNFYGTAKR